MFADRWPQQLAFLALLSVLAFVIAGIILVQPTIFETEKLRNGDRADANPAPRTRRTRKERLASKGSSSQLLDLQVMH